MFFLCFPAQSPTFVVVPFPPYVRCAAALDRPSSMTITQTPDRLYFLCALIGAGNFILFCAAAMAMLRVLRAAARDAYNNPRRRLLELDDGVARRRPGKLCAVCSACWPWTTQKALLAMVAFAAARESDERSLSDDSLLYPCDCRIRVQTNIQVRCSPFVGA